MLSDFSNAENGQGERLESDSHVVVPELVMGDEGVPFPYFFEEEEEDAVTSLN